MLMEQQSTDRKVNMDVTNIDEYLKDTMDLAEIVYVRLKEMDDYLGSLDFDSETGEPLPGVSDAKLERDHTVQDAWCDAYELWVKTRDAVADQMAVEKEEAAA